MPRPKWKHHSLLSISIPHLLFLNLLFFPYLIHFTVPCYSYILCERQGPGALFKTGG
jgi:hypothetical protein